MYRKYASNSYDDYLAWKQEDKIGVELATNAYDPKIRSLLIRLLNEHQKEVNEAHNSDAGKKVLSDMQGEASTRQRTQQALLEELAEDHNDEQSAKDEEEAPVTDPAQPENDSAGAQRRPAPRKRTKPERYHTMQFDNEGRRKAAPTAQDTICSVCEEIVERKDNIQCSACKDVSHLLCVGLEKRPRSKTAFECPYCLAENGDDDDDLRGHSSEDSNDESGVDTDDEYEDAASSGSDKDDSADPNDHPGSFLTEVDFKQFINEHQVDDATAKLRFLLVHPYGKEYDDEDLNDEVTLEKALRLLYAARTGEGQLRAKHGIHISYTHIHSSSGKEVKK